MMLALPFLLVVFLLPANAGNVHVSVFGFGCFPVVALVDNLAPCDDSDSGFSAGL